MSPRASETRRTKSVPVGLVVLGIESLVPHRVRRAGFSRGRERWRSRDLAAPRPDAPKQALWIAETSSERLLPKLLPNPVARSDTRRDKEHFKGEKSQPFRGYPGPVGTRRDDSTRTRRSRRGPARPGGRDPAAIRSTGLGNRRSDMRRGRPLASAVGGIRSAIFPGRGGDGVARLSARRVPSGRAGLSISRRVIWCSDANACQPHDAPGHNRACGVRMGSANRTASSLFGELC